MRPWTTLVLVVLMAFIVGATLFQFFVLAR